MSSPSDPRETVKCACPRIDAQDCVDTRNGRDLRRLLDAETLADAADDGDGCPCACHEIHEGVMQDDGDYPVSAFLVAASACRRCSECPPPDEHHWLDNDECADEADATHACKHCIALGDECETCDGEGGRVSPDGYVLATCPRCKGYGVVARIADDGTKTGGTAR